MKTTAELPGRTHQHDSGEYSDESRALHESGHALVAVSLRRCCYWWVPKLRHVTIKIDRRRSLGGYVSFWRTPHIPPLGELNLNLTLVSCSQIAVRTAGALAEAISKPERRIDYSRPHLQGDWECVERTLETFSEAARKDLVRLSTAVALQILGDQKETLFKVAQTLRRKHKLSGRQTEALIRQGYHYDGLQRLFEELVSDCTQKYGDDLFSIQLLSSLVEAQNWDAS